MQKLFATYQNNNVVRSFGSHVISDDSYDVTINPQDEPITSRALQR